MKQITIDFSHSLGTINPNIYGHFSEHIGGVFYDGLWVGEDSKVENIRGFRKAAVESFKKIHPPVLRWPGGCFAETYDWRDGIGPREKRPRRVNWWYFSDHRTESNQVGTHEFMDFCHMVGAKPYVAANITSVTPLHIRDWVEYCNFPQGLTSLADERAANGSPDPFNVEYWGIGNENWGGGGQMSPEKCAREFMRFSTVCRALDADKLHFIMCGATGTDVEWTRRLMKEWTDRAWQEVKTYGLSIHYYTNALSGSDDVYFDEDGWYDELFRAAYMKKVVESNRAAMDEFDPQRKVKLVVDEWGNWHKDGTGPSKGYNLFEQQSNVRDAVVAALTLNIFNNHCDYVDMANVAQLCNNLHSLYLAQGEHFIETPNYHVFDMYQGHQGGKQLNTLVDCPVLHRDQFEDMYAISASASIKGDVLTLTMANLDLVTAQTVSLNSLGRKLTGKGTLKILTHQNPNTCNTFEDPYQVVPAEQQMTFKGEDVITLPAASVVALTLQLA